jgi:cytochrome c-type biogenesis protein CcmH/NrfG
VKNRTQQLLRDAITAAREGDKARARLLLEEIVEQDEQNEKAWYWLASVAETDEDRILYLNNVIAINPNNERARSVLDQIEDRHEGTDQTVRRAG